jgi:hypothetical protein
MYKYIITLFIQSINKLFVHSILLYSVVPKISSAVPTWGEREREYRQACTHTGSGRRRRLGLETIDGSTGGRHVHTRGREGGGGLALKQSMDRRGAVGGSHRLVFALPYATDARARRRQRRQSPKFSRDATMHDEVLPA